MNALFQGAVDVKQVDKNKAVSEINALIKWQEERKKWHQDKTRQKMAAEGTAGGVEATPGSKTFKSSDFGLDQVCLILYVPPFISLKFSYATNIFSPPRALLTLQS